MEVNVKTSNQDFKNVALAAQRLIAAMAAAGIPIEHEKRVVNDHEAAKDMLAGMLARRPDPLDQMLAEIVAAEQAEEDPDALISAMLARTPPLQDDDIDALFAEVFPDVDSSSRPYEPRSPGKRGPAEDKRGNREKGRRPAIPKALAGKIKWVAQHRQELGLSTKNVADHYGVSLSTVKKYGARGEQDARRPGLVAIEPVGDERWWK